ncbi:MAG: efflux RND transporter periplasmic adaptor subunit [Candidatus Magnetomorum sp.]|nr:efflux RND transporter periplasmic adaptor subunit [Candidatus Magnetomorum sp.]
MPSIEQEYLQQKIALFEQALSLMILLNEEDRFLSAVMTLCNEIATRLQASRVSLGWLTGKYVKIQGMSHIEHFEPKMGAVQELETAMEEALDQNEEILFPSEQEQWSAVVRSHASYVRKFGSEKIVSIPLRVNETPVAILTCERAASFTIDDVRGLRMICDQVSRRLFDLKQSDRWFGARFTGWIRKKLSKIFGFEHTFARLVSIICAALFLYVLFGHKVYFIKAPCMLKTDNLAYIQAPFNGFISSVNVQMGDITNKGDLLLELDTRDLRLKEAEIVADIHQFSRAEEKARSQDYLADMRIAQARLKKSQLELQRILYLLDQAKVKAPFSGIVVQGERQKLLGAPVREGDVMYKIAEMRDYYVQLDVDEQDIHEIKTGHSGNMAFISRPEIKFPIKISQISYTAQVKDKKNIFELRATFEGEPQQWWRAGMSGIVHIDVGQRRLIWIFTHRTIDFIRLYLFI